MFVDRFFVFFREKLFSGVVVIKDVNEWVDIIFFVVIDVVGGVVLFNVVVFVRFVCVWEVVCKDDVDVIKVGIDVSCVFVWRDGIVEDVDGIEIVGVYVGKDDVDFIVEGGIDVFVKEFDFSVFFDNDMVVMFVIRGWIVDGRIIEELFFVVDILVFMFNSGL